MPVNILCDGAVYPAVLWPAVSGTVVQVQSNRQRSHSMLGFLRAKRLPAYTVYVWRHDFTAISLAAFQI